MRIDPAGPTLNALLGDWERHLAATEISRGHRADLLTAVRVAAETMAWTWPGQVTADTVTDYLLRRKAGGASPKYRNDLRQALLQFSEWGRTRGGPDIDPRAVPRARIKRRRVRYVPTTDEVVRLIAAACSDWRKKDRWLVYLVAATTGLRMKTLRLLAWEHVHLEAMAKGGGGGGSRRQGGHRLARARPDDREER